MDFIKSKLKILFTNYWKYLLGILLLIVISIPVYKSVRSYFTQPEIKPLPYPEKHDYSFDVEYEACQFNTDIENHIERHNYCIIKAQEKLK